MDYHEVHAVESSAHRREPESWGTNGRWKWVFLWIYGNDTVETGNPWRKFTYYGQPRSFGSTECLDYRIYLSYYSSVTP
jgi:hypothetical protein